MTSFWYSIKLSIQLSIALYNARLSNIDPLQGWRIHDDPEKTNAKFIKDFALEDIAHLINTVTISQEKSTVQTYMFTCKEPIGTITDADPVTDALYTVVSDQGSLAIKGPVNVSTDETSSVTFVIDYSDNCLGVLKSVYPGCPDPSPDFSGLKEGDQITYDELIKRGLFNIIPA